MSIKAIATAEKELYDRLYDGRCCDTTGYWREIAGYIAATSQPKDKLLDIGCGHGDPTRLLCSLDRNCVGVDISLAGLGSQRKTGSEYDEFLPTCSFTEAPIWDMPFEDNEFDYTFSFDVMEHIPTEAVEASIRELYRVTKGKMLHCISVEDDPMYVEAHKTVKPIKWWKAQFAAGNTEGIETGLFAPDKFKILMHITAQEAYDSGDTA